MKKVITIFSTLLIIAVLFTGCKSKPDDVSQQMYDYGVEALDIADAYLDGSISATVAETKLETIKNKSDIIGSNIRDAGYEKYHESEYKKDMIVNSHISSLYMSLSVNNLLGKDSADEIKETRDKLADDLNY